MVQLLQHVGGADIRAGTTLVVAVNEVGEHADFGQRLGVPAPRLFFRHAAEGFPDARINHGIQFAAGMEVVTDAALIPRREHAEALIVQRRLISRRAEITQLR